MEKKLYAIGEALIDFIPQESGRPMKDVLGFCPKVGGAPANVLLSFKLDAPAPCRLDAPDLDLICYASADCLHQHLQVI